MTVHELLLRLNQIFINLIRCIRARFNVLLVPTYFYFVLVQHLFIANNRFLRSATDVNFYIVFSETVLFFLHCVENAVWKTVGEEKLLSNAYFDVWIYMLCTLHRQIVFRFFSFFSYNGKKRTEHNLCNLQPFYSFTFECTHTHTFLLCKCSFSTVAFTLIAHGAALTAMEYFMKW